jgi:PAT family beta-lactamase induction signal transducer AmpG
MTAQIAAPQMTRFRIPAFADSRNLRLFLGTVLYLAQGFPQGVFFAAIPTWLAANGQSTAVVASAAAAAALPWSFKFLAGLFLDRYTWRPMGRRRPWLIGSQAGIAACLLIAAFISPAPGDTAVVLAIILILSTLTAIQDVALDALVIDLTPDGEKGRMNGFMLGGKVFGIAGGIAITSYLLEHYGFSIAMLGILLCFFIPAFAVVSIRERKGEKLLPWSSGSASKDGDASGSDDWGMILRAVFRNLIQRRTIIMVLVLMTYGIHQSLNDTTNGLFVIRQLGWTQSEYGSMSAAFNIVIGIFCLTIGGWMVDRFGPGRIAFWSGLAALPIMLSYLVDVSLWQDSRLFIVWIGMKSVPLFLFYLANLAMAMRVTAAEVAATSFSVLMAVGAVGFLIASAILPSLEALGGFQAMYGASAVLICFAGLLTLLLHKDVRQAVTEEQA